MATVTGRFAAPDLLRLGPPPALAATQTIEAMVSAAKADLVTRMNAVGIPYDVSVLESDPGVILTEAGVYRDYLRRVEIDDAIRQTFLGSATGSFLDRRCSDYGVLRRVWPTVYTDAIMPGILPSNLPPAWTWGAVTGGYSWTEDDESLRTRGFLAWQALSVAGPAGAYVYHTLNAHPDVFDAVVYGPESGYVSPGQVLVVVQSYTNGGVPTAEVLDSVSAVVDAHKTTYASGATVTRSAYDPQNIRPIGAQVFVVGAQPLTYAVSATLYVAPGNDPTGTQVNAIARLAAYQAKRNRVGLPVTLSGMTSALGISDVNGVPLVDKVVLSSPMRDVTPNYQQIAVMSAAAQIDVIVR